MERRNERFGKKIYLLILWILNVNKIRKKNTDIKERFEKNN